MNSPRQTACGCHQDATGTPRAAGGPVGPARRQVLVGAGTAAVAVAVVAACGSGSQPPANASEGSGPTTGTVVVKAADVPVGGGVVVPAERVVVTQPSAGQFKAFSVVCPHQGCSVTTVRDGFIICPCHGSQFAVATGEPTAGSPAKSGLTPRPVTNVDGQITAQ